MRPWHNRGKLLIKFEQNYSSGAFLQKPHDIHRALCAKSSCGRGTTRYCAGLENRFPKGYPGSNPGGRVYHFIIAVRLSICIRMLADIPDSTVNVIWNA